MRLISSSVVTRTNRRAREFMQQWDWCHVQFQVSCFHSVSSHRPLRYRTSVAVNHSISRNQKLPKMPLLEFSEGANDSCQTQTGLYKTNNHTTFRFQLQNLDKISIITLMPLLCLMSLDHWGFHWKSCEKTDSITQSYPLDLAVKSLPLCILEHCWSSQIIKKTQEWEGGLTPLPLPPLTTFAVSNPICRISRDARAPRCTTGNGKTGQGAYRVVYNDGQHYGMYSPEMKCDAFPDELWHATICGAQY